MYYLLKDGRIIDTKDYLGCQYGDDRNILYIEYNEDGLPISKRVLEQEYEAKSENLLDLARGYDLIEIKNHDKTKPNFIIQIQIENNRIYDVSTAREVLEEVVALWKHRGNIMERHEVK